MRTAALKALDLFRLNGRRAVVAGGAGGIGRAITEALLESGCEAGIIGRSPETIRVADELGCIAVRADLTSSVALRHAFNDVVSALGGVDILVNSQGVANGSIATAQTLEDWNQTLAVNLTSVFELCQCAGQIMVGQGKGKIINIASNLSFSGGYGISAYSASKGGVAQFTRAISTEFASQGVNVNAIAPGYIRTKLNSNSWRDPRESSKVLSRIPAGRWGETDDLKGAAVFLASQASDFVNGIILPVDGGWLAA